MSRIKASLKLMGALFLTFVRALYVAVARKIYPALSLTVPTMEVEKSIAEPLAEFVYIVMMDKSVTEDERNDLMARIESDIDDREKKNNESGRRFMTILRNRLQFLIDNPQKEVG